MFPKYIEDLTEFLLIFLFLFIIKLLTIYTISSNDP